MDPCISSLAFRVPLFVIPEGNPLLTPYRRHPERSEGPLYFAFAVVCPLFVIPEGNLLLSLDAITLTTLFRLSFPKGIRFCRLMPSPSPPFFVCHSRREPAFVA
jgi:hypothetical protein